MSAGIKETLEMLDGVEVLIKLEKKVMSDGRIDLGDLGALLDLLKSLKVLNAAVQGIDGLPAEFKDLDADEAEQIVNKVLALVALMRS